MEDLAQDQERQRWVFQRPSSRCSNPSTPQKKCDTGHGGLTLGSWWMGHVQKHGFFGALLNFPNVLTSETLQVVNELRYGRMDRSWNGLEAKRNRENVEEGEVQ